MLKEMLKEIKKMFSSGRDSENVGRVFYSQYFMKAIEVTSYKSDDDWRFKLVKSPNEKEFRAGSKLSYFVENDLELPRLETIKTKEEFENLLNEYKKRGRGE